MSDRSSANTLSVRSPLPGRTVADEVSCEGVWDTNAGRIVILIHGYNTSVEDARSSYTEFKQALAKALPGGREGRLGVVWDFFWPGDDPRAAISLATYNVRVSEAMRSALPFAEFLGRQSSKLRVVLVAHSLGCRVALETLRAIRLAEPYGGAQIEAVFLLAAAVPTRQCRTEASYPEPHPRCREHVVSSRHDAVLLLAFRPGQYVSAGGDAWYERGPAVGRDGSPDDRWSTRRPTKLGHGDYWGSDEVARWICATLGVLADRGIGERPAPTCRVSESRQFARRRHIPSRLIRARHTR